MSVFPKFGRNDNGPRQRGESLFSFHNRSASTESADEREWLERQVGTWSKSERRDMINRLRSHDQDHRNARFELIVAERLSQAGATLTHHPKLTKARGRPDFYVERWPEFSQPVALECVTSNPSQHGLTLTAAKALKKSIASKAGKYGRLPCPLILAYCDMRGVDGDVPDTDIINALNDQAELSGLWVFRDKSSDVPRLVTKN